MNQVRVRASKDYVRSSDHLWLVTPIGRCVTDTSVDTNLFTYGDRFSERLSIICTKTDDPMKPTEFKHAYPEHAKTLSELNKKRRDAQQLHTKAKAALKRARRPSTVEMCNTNVERYATKHAKARRNYLHYMMITRNKKIKALIYAEKSEYFKKGEREIIFPVSSKHYVWLKGYRDAEAEDDSPPNHNVTGIPMLRKHALRVPAPEMWSTFMTHTQHTLVGCIKALRIWASNISGIEGDTLSKVTNDSVKVGVLIRAKYTC